MPIKTRGGVGTSVPRTASYEVFNADGSPTGQSGTFDITQFKPSRSERIAYDNGRSKFNACSHQAGGAAVDKLASYHSVTPGGAYVAYKDVPWTSTISPYVPIGAFPGGLWEAALEKATPKLSSPVSIPNFLWELRDLPKLWTSVFPKLKGIQADKRVSKLGLAYYYGLAPLLSDIHNLLNSYDQFLKDYRKFSQSVNKVLIAKHKAVEPGSNVPVRTIVAAGNPYSEGTMAYYGDATYVATIKYSYSLSGGAPMPPPMPDVFYRYMGLRGNPRIIWDAIPFSFVVDWVLKVGDWLSQFDEGAIPVKMTVLDACQSYKQEVTVYYGRLYTPSSGYTGRPSGDIILGNGKYKNYQRSPVLPQDLLHVRGLVMNGLSVKEIALGGLLLNANRR